ncbi:hypothetical protein, partial [Marvinbryantia sp.]|uniref:hypothetical protein n=1 Tax=Marvinbryantia sp. TaxID=2496532 RepID=UPI003A91DD03
HNTIDLIFILHFCILYPVIALPEWISLSYSISQKRIVYKLQQLPEITGNIIEKEKWTPSANNKKRCISYTNI